MGLLLMVSNNLKRRFSDRYIILTRSKSKWNEMKWRICCTSSRRNQTIKSTLGYRLSSIVQFYDQSIRALPQSNKLHPWNNCIHLLLSFYRFFLPIFHIRFQYSQQCTDYSQSFRMQIYALLIVMCYRLSINLTACKRQNALITGHSNWHRNEIQSRF